MTREFLKKNVKLSGKPSLAAVYVLINQMILIKNLSLFCCCLGNRKCHSLSNWCQIPEPSIFIQKLQFFKKKLKVHLSKINLVSSLNGRETMQCSKFSNQDAKQCWWRWWWRFAHWAPKMADIFFLARANFRLLIKSAPVPSV